MIIRQGIAIAGFKRIVKRMGLKRRSFIIEFAGEKTHYFNGGMIARRRTVRM